MTDPRAEALARFHETAEHCRAFEQSWAFRAGYDARDEEVASLTIEAKVARGNAAAACTLLELKDTELAALKAEVERLCMAIYDCDAFPGEHLLRAAARAALAAAGRKAP